MKNLLRSLSADSTQNALPLYLSGALILLGVIGILIGLSQVISLPQQSNIEILSEPSELLDSNQATHLSPEPKNETLTVDLSGAVVEPGLYQVESGTRVGQVLEVGGGVTATASKIYLAQQLNLAELVKDGQKIYIPTEKEFRAQQVPSTTGSTTTAAQSPQSNLISINSATQSQLESLPGIGAVRAQQIIDHRPYAAIEQLVDQKVVTEKIFTDIHDQISL